MRNFLRSWFYTAAKFEVWKEGDQAEVLQPIPSDQFQKVFKVDEKFIVQEAIPTPQHGVYMLFGGRLGGGILSYRCKKITE